ncbi:MAG: hypothetical protein ACP5M9_00725 [Candidatus Micrarchaeia archaeon]
MENLEIKLNDKKENKLLKRYELSFTAYYKGETPKKDTLKEEICKMQNLNPSFTTITKIDQQYGVQESIVYVNSYLSEADMSRYERKKEAKADKVAKAANPEAKK